MIGRVKNYDTKFFTPMDYQVELLQCAINHNTIVTLGTGLGKTFIAVLLIKEFKCRIVENNEKAFFIVDKIQLVDQQASHIESHCDLSVARVYGGFKSFYDSKEKFQTFFDSFQVLIITAQVFLDFLDRAYFNLSSAAVLIFDECHHSLGKRHPYRLIMDYYRQLPFESRGRILGLTASVINKKVPIAKLKLSLEHLELIMCSKLETTNDLTSISKYGPTPLQFIIPCPNEKSKNIEVRNILNKMLVFVHENDLLNPIVDVDPKPPIREAVQRIFSILDQLGLWFAWRASIICQKRMQKYIDEPIFSFEQKRLFRVAETAFFTCTKILSNEVGKIKTLEQLKPYLNSRVTELFNLLRFYKPKNCDKSDLCALIFVRERFVAFLLNVLLREVAKWHPDEFGFINSDFIVGQSVTFVSTSDVNAAHKRQESALQKFRANIINVSVQLDQVDQHNLNLELSIINPSPKDMYYFELSLKLAEEALEQKEVPVGCVLVYNDEIIGRGKNKVNETKNPTLHAEFVSFIEAENWCIKNKANFSEVMSKSVLYVSLEPCVMCASALYQLRIKKLFFGALNPRFGGIKSVGSNELYHHNHTIIIVENVNIEKSIGLIKRFYERENPFAPDEKRKAKKNDLKL